VNPHSHEFDVFVSEGALVEVWRGDHISVAQQFGVDWDGPSHSVIHAAVFEAPAASAAFTPPAGEPVVTTADLAPPPVPWHKRLVPAWWIVGVMLCAVGVGAVLASGLARGW
jgi:hypothetical protein